MCGHDQDLLTRDPAEATLALTINGKPCKAFETETILHCARRHDTYVPTLCELNDIDHTPGTCRVCVVEIQQTGKDAPQIVTACNTPVREGMEVQTRSKKARDMQRLQVEQLMADHLQDCATCIRHGNCELPDLAQYVGLKENRFFDRALTEQRPIDLSSPSMVRDMTRCVRCQRCVAICRHHQGVDALVMEGNGIDRVVALRNTDSYPESLCVSCGQCVPVCPTGALGERYETDKALDFIRDPEVTTVVQFAPAVRVAFGEEFGMPAGTNVEGQIIAACPGGCVDGGGSLRSKKEYLPLAKARRETIYTVDRKAKVRQSHNNPQVETLYKEFLGAPNGEKPHALLDTQYEDRKRELHHTVNEIWDNITMGSVVY